MTKTREMTGFAPWLTSRVIHNQQLDFVFVWLQPVFIVWWSKSKTLLSTHRYALTYTHLCWECSCFAEVANNSLPHFKDAREICKLLVQLLDSCIGHSNKDSRCHRILLFVRFLSWNYLSTAGKNGTMTSTCRQVFTGLHFIITANTAKNVLKYWMAFTNARAISLALESNKFKVSWAQCVICVYEKFTKSSLLISNVLFYHWLCGLDDWNLQK